MVSLDLTAFFQSRDDFMVQSAGPRGEWGGLTRALLPAVLLTRFLAQGAGWGSLPWSCCEDLNCLVYAECLTLSKPASSVAQREGSWAALAFR